ncbi:MAG: sugar nucleotide-binding protein, partial [Verrucomicrobiales bacterium]
MRILVTGASGLLGNAVAEAAVEAGHQVIAVSNTNPATVIGVARAELIEGTDGDAFTGLCCGLRPAVIINCAALSNPASVDERPEEAQAINVAMPGMLAGLAYELDARFLHISTDMVFDGLAEHPYGAGDATNPSNLYG